MATGLQLYQTFTGAIDRAEAHLHELGARWSLKGTVSHLLFELLCI